MADSNTEAESPESGSRGTSSAAPEVPVGPTPPDEHHSGESTQSGPNQSPTPDLIREESRIVQLLEQINNNQEQILRLLHDGASPGHGIIQVAQTIWRSPHNARSYEAGELAEFRKDTIALAFLKLFAPFGVPWAQSARDAMEPEPNLITARNSFRHRAGEFEFKSWDPEITLSNIDQWWPSTWDHFRDNRDLYNSRALSYMFADSFDDAFGCESVSTYNLEHINEQLMLGRQRPLRGIVCHIVSWKFEEIHFEAVAAILCLLPVYSPIAFEFLEQYIRAWQELPVVLRNWADVIPNQAGDWALRSSRREYLFYYTLLHHLRAFTPADPEADQEQQPTAGRAGLKCSRDWVTFTGFYGESAMKLVERRYSVAVSILPLQRPCGHYVLASIVDGSQPRKRSDLGINSFSGMPRETFGIQPAGLCNGISVFQIQLCGLIAMWKADWINTIDEVDKKVSVTLDDLRNNKHLRSLVLDSDSDASVSYFKVLRMLNIFSDAVRPAYSRLEALARKENGSTQLTDRLAEYPHRDETNRVLAYNWDTVLKHQEEASNVVLERLARTTKEVQGLMDGLFSVQSVTEAQKSRLLNKYILVFTIIAIIFLPPTFVSTFFGVDIFETTKATFWTVFAALSGASYVCAALGLFWSSLSRDDRVEWSDWGTERSRAVKQSFADRSRGLRESFVDKRWHPSFLSLRRRPAQADGESISLDEMGGSS